MHWETVSGKIREKTSRYQVPFPVRTLKRNLVPFGFLFFLLFIFLPTSAAEQEEVQVDRDEKGAIIHQDQRLVIPEDRKIVRVAANVIRAEDDDLYVKRKLDAFETRVAGLETRLASVEAELEKMKVEKAAQEKLSQSEVKQIS